MSEVLRMIQYRFSTANTAAVDKSETTRRFKIQPFLNGVSNSCSEKIKQLQFFIIVMSSTADKASEIFIYLHRLSAAFIAQTS